MIKVAFDAKRIFYNKTGLGNYSRDLIHALAEYCPDLALHLYTPKKKHPISFVAADATIHYPKQNFLSSLWRIKTITRDLAEDKMTIFHGLSNELPLGIRKTTIRTVVSIHDLIFERFPSYYPLIDRKIFARKFKYAAQIADSVVAMSVQTKQDLINYYDISPHKITVIYQNCHAFFKQNSPIDTSVLEKYNLKKPYLLSVGTIEERKNIALIIKALVKVPQILLVVVGKKTLYFDEVMTLIKKNNLEKRIFFLEQVSLLDLVQLYKQAEIFIYPSRFEGFGIPILEALYSQTPVIAATGSCLAEVGGKHSVYVNPDDEFELSNAINMILNDAQLKAEMIKKGYAHALTFNDAQMAKSYNKLYQSLV